MNVRMFLGVAALTASTLLIAPMVAAADSSGQSTIAAQQVQTDHQTASADSVAARRA